tara:strand:- start:16 stop:576 length:561 start_codon:yes stop_codon:yes gene_type:complete
VYSWGVGSLCGDAVLKCGKSSRRRFAVDSIRERSSTTSPVRDGMAVTPKVAQWSRASAVGTAYKVFRSTIIGAGSLSTTLTYTAQKKLPYQASAVAHGDFSATLRNDVVMEGLAQSNLFNWAQKNPVAACGILGWVFTPLVIAHSSSGSFDKRVLDSSVYLVYLTVPMFSLISALGKKLILLRLML